MLTAAAAQAGAREIEKRETPPIDTSGANTRIPKAIERSEKVMVVAA